jgi:outer membrane protein assembly factor BamA
MKDTFLIFGDAASRRQKIGAFFCLLAILLVGFVKNGVAQEPAAESLAGENAADALKQAQTNQPYNLQLGPVSLRADATVAASFNDNVNIAKDGRQADCIISPTVGVTGNWQVTDLNTLTFSLGVGYQEYLQHSEYSTFLLSPGSDVNFNLFVGDVRLRFYDQFSYQEDPVAVGQLSNVAEFDRFQNVAGVRADWDLGDMVLSADFNHASFWVYSEPYKYLSYQSDTISPEITFKISPTIEAGLMSAFTDVRYSEDVEPDQDSASGGPYVTANITDNLAVTVEAGYYYARYDGGSLNGDPSSSNSTYYANLSLNHRINDVLQESFTAGRETILGVNTDYTERVFAAYNANWNATAFLNIGANAWWENLNDSGGPFGENANRYGVGLTLSYQLMDHLSASLGYQFVIKDADPSFYSYYQNVVTLGLSYHF